MATLEHEQLSGKLSVTYATTAVSEKFATEPQSGVPAACPSRQTPFGRVTLFEHSESIAHAFESNSQNLESDYRKSI
ncbi:hypothetical protein LC049_22040 [Nitratireductor aquimarinus]|uniref:hypothetical protein n=1 Tax=Nitratireductor aquimarinus TaxID=889300 RepID=UPI001C97F063|nr:hypothetical protein [Nitratireductor aquimarinus]MBY6134080.1 hypothetical protein [Nitratireductor aquimarinus]MCA1305176.1 hypothetical protein [Nitratireductor aquimarinus]